MKDLRVLLLAATPGDALAIRLDNFSNGAARKALALPSYDANDKEWFLGLRDVLREAAAKTTSVAAAIPHLSALLDERDALRGALEAFCADYLLSVNPECEDDLSPAFIAARAALKETTR